MLVEYLVECLNIHILDAMDHKFGVISTSTRETMLSARTQAAQSFVYVKVSAETTQQFVLVS